MRDSCPLSGEELVLLLFGIDVQGRRGGPCGAVCGAAVCCGAAEAVMMLFVALCCWGGVLGREKDPKEKGENRSADPLGGPVSGVEKRRAVFLLFLPLSLSLSLRTHRSERGATLHALLAFFCPPLSLAFFLLLL